MQSVRVTRDALANLARDSRVTRLSLDHPVLASLDRTARVIGADQAWAGASKVKGVTGNGVVVAVIESGVGPSGLVLPDLGGSVKKTTTFLGKNVDVADGYGHGTHVAGIIA